LGRKYQISINSGLTSAIIGSIIIEGVGRQLNPEMRFIDEARGVMSCASDLRAMYFKERFSKFYENNIKMLSSQDPYINYIEDSSIM
jgi:predicted unusual protein kinase regulating ubiquinone biosynthesis (AarF/ABC1/UbiB family)